MCICGSYYKDIQALKHLFKITKAYQVNAEANLKTTILSIFSNKCCICLKTKDNSEILVCLCLKNVDLNLSFKHLACMNCKPDKFLPNEYLKHLLSLDL